MLFVSHTRRWLTASLVLAILITSVMVATQPVQSQNPAPQRVESDDARVSRSGTWTSQTATAASGGNYLFNSANQPDAALSLDFYGSYLEVIYVSGPSLGTLAIEVDGSVLRTVITTDSATRYGQSAKFTYLSDEWHTLRVYAQEGGVVALDAMVVTLEGPAEVTAAPAAPRDPAQENAVFNPPAPVETVASDVASVSRAAGEPRAIPTNVVITEIDAGSVDAVELHNPTGTAINLTNFTMRLYDDFDALDNTYVFPAFYLFPGAYVVLFETSGTNTNNILYWNNAIFWDWASAGGSGAVELRNSGGTVVDFVRWGDSTVTPSNGPAWGAGTSPSVGEQYQSMHRTISNNDTNSPVDWAPYCISLGQPLRTCLQISEAFYGFEDQFEIYNPTVTAISLSNLRLQVWDELNVLDADYTFPSFTLQPGAFVIVSENSGTNTGLKLFMNNPVFFTELGGAVALLTSGASAGLDFMRFGSNTVVAPTGTSWSGEAIPSAVGIQNSMARGNGNADFDRTSDWCNQPPSLLAKNDPCVVINEVDTGVDDYIEIHNASLTAYPLTGWNVQFIEAAGAVAIDYTVPTFTLNAGAYVRVYEGAGTNTTTTLFANSSVFWADADSGAAYITNIFGTSVDFVRWGSNPTLLSNFGSDFTGPPLPVSPTAASGLVFGRNASSADQNLTDDWCIVARTAGSRNGGCAGRAALFLPSSNYVSLVSSIASPPAPNDYYTYIANVPTTSTNGQWVMGDWDGDGDKTPGVYYTSGASAGVFFITNDYGPSATWTATWFGLFAGVAGNVPVAGRFSAGSTNDCLGVIDSASFPPFGTAFALYFTCTTSGGNPTKTFQWVSVLLPDNQGFSGTFQFGVGDYNIDGIDTVACRRGEYIAFSNTPPTTQNGEFPLAQYIGTPPGASGSNNFVVGDWDADGYDTFGLYYAAQGRHWFRNDLQFNTGIYGYRDLYLPLGTTATAGSWNGY